MGRIPLLLRIIQRHRDLRAEPKPLLASEDTDTRAKINEALLRYRELDTMALVMIVQAWRDFLETTV